MPISTKRTTPKHKSTKRKTPKRKTPKRKTPKRKSTKRKSTKRKSPRKKNKVLKGGGAMIKLYYYDHITTYSNTILEKPSGKEHEITSTKKGDVPTSFDFEIDKTFNFSNASQEGDEGTAFFVKLEGTAFPYKIMNDSPGSTPKKIGTIDKDSIITFDKYSDISFYFQKPDNDISTMNKRVPPNFIKGNTTYSTTSTMRDDTYIIFRTT
jgi:hypothetical protein